MANHSPRKLYRSGDDRIIAGVCGGIGEYFDIDPVLVRIAFVILAFGGGTGILAYIILALIIPVKPGHPGSNTQENVGELVEKAADTTKEFLHDLGDRARHTEHARRGGHGRNIIGAIIIGVGVLALLDQVFPWWFGWHMVWPLALVLLGVWVIVGRES